MPSKKQAPIHTRKARRAGQRDVDIAPATKSSGKVVEFPPKLIIIDEAELDIDEEPEADRWVEIYEDNSELWSKTSPKKVRSKKAVPKNTAGKKTRGS